MGRTLGIGLGSEAEASWAMKTKRSLEVGRGSEMRAKGSTSSRMRSWSEAGVRRLSGHVLSMSSTSRSRMRTMRTMRQTMTRASELEIRTKR